VCVCVCMFLSVSTLCKALRAFKLCVCVKNSYSDTRIAKLLLYLTLDVIHNIRHRDVRNYERKKFFENVLFFESVMLIPFTAQEETNCKRINYDSVQSCEPKVDMKIFEEVNKKSLNCFVKFLLFCNDTIVFNVHPIYIYPKYIQVSYMYILFSNS